MQDAVLNLCRVKLRDQQRLAHGPLKEYPQYPDKTFGPVVPRSGNASGGGHPGVALKCKPGGPNDYIYVVVQAQVWGPLMQADWPRGTHRPSGLRHSGGASLPPG